MAVRAVAAVLLAAGFLSGCGGSSSGGAPAPAAPASSVSSPSASASTSYEATIFKPAFSVTLPAGWTVAERDEGAAQIYKLCGTCQHGGEENGEITLDMAMARKSPKAAIARLREASNVVASKALPFHVGQLAGFAFVAKRTGHGDVAFKDNGYVTSRTGLPLHVYAVKAGGRTMTVILDPPIHRTDEAKFASAARRILASLKVK